MPIEYGTAVPTDDIPADLLAAAEESDAMIEGELAGMMKPFDRPISPKVMNALAKAIAAGAATMGFEVIPDRYTEPVSELEPSVVRMLGMLAAAAEDYGKPLPVAIDAIATEQDLTAITAALTELARDKDFVAFLDVPVEDADAEGGVAIGIEVSPEGGEDFDFASRMRPGR